MEQNKSSTMYHIHNMLQRERASAIQPIMESEFDSPAKAEKEEPWSWGKKKKKACEGPY